jgi:hypothetical protein
VTACYSQRVKTSPLPTMRRSAGKPGFSNQIKFIHPIPSHLDQPLPKAPMFRRVRTRCSRWIRKGQDKRADNTPPRRISVISPTMAPNLTEPSGKNNSNADGNEQQPAQDTPSPTGLENEQSFLFVALHYSTLNSRLTA